MRQKRRRKKWKKKYTIGVTLTFVVTDSIIFLSSVNKPSLSYNHQPLSSLSFLSNFIAFLNRKKNNQINKWKSTFPINALIKKEKKLKKIQKSMKWLPSPDDHLFPIFTSLDEINRCLYQLETPISGQKGARKREQWFQLIYTVLSPVHFDLLLLLFIIIFFPLFSSLLSLLLSSFFFFLNFFPHSENNELSSCF